jgi:hypothetical protein
MITIISIILLLVLGVVIVRFESFGQAWRYLRAHSGPAKGIMIFMGGFTALVIAVFLIGGHAKAADFKYLQFAEAFAGVEWPIVSASYQCNPKGPDDKTVSNLGARVNLFTYRKFIDANIKWQHNSCAFNEDWDVRDFIGVELVIPLFDRRK